ncbi:hypothetical protein C8J57DRAFT_444969 [Mycena rebaudengoi]|nr:hypothetical protein C8J57DRAFT_444969 [Mycena rebaudengoi]
MDAKEFAMKAHEYAEHLGDLFGQAFSLYLQAKSHLLLANYQHATVLLRNSRDTLTSCGLQGGTLGLYMKNLVGEIHILKTEYQEARGVQVSIASQQPMSSKIILAKLNIALIDIVTGIDSNLVLQNLDTCKFHLKEFYGLTRNLLARCLEVILADLHLRDGNHTLANTIFATCFSSLRNISMDHAFFSLEQLADLSTGMNNIQTSLRWSGVFLALALRSKDKLVIMKAFRCLGQVIAAQRDHQTALRLFTLALDGLTFMDIHRWRADCMVRIAYILEDQGEITKAVGLWKAARSLFERSSQIKYVTWVDAKLAAVDSSI